MLAEHAVYILSRLSAAFSLPIRHYHQKTLIHNWSERSFPVDLARLYVEPYFDRGAPLYAVVSPKYLVSGYLALPDPREYLVIGPALPYEMTPGQCISILEELSLPASQMEELNFYFHFLPHMTVEHFNIALELVWTVIYPSLENIPHPAVYTSGHRNNLETSGTEAENAMNDGAEQMVFSVVASGQVEQLDEVLEYIYASPEDYGLGRLAPSRVRAMKNTLIASAALVSRKAVECGIDYTTSLAISDYYIYKIEQTDTISGLTELGRAMLIDYTRRIGQLRTPASTSPLVTSIYRDIQAHKYEKVTVSDIAKRLSFSPGYLSHHFKEAAGVTLSDYIHEQKIAEAKQLLERTDLSLAEIAAKMGFSSQQQFQQLFRRITGETPAAYRRSRQT